MAKKGKKDLWLEQFNAGRQLVFQNPIFALGVHIETEAEFIQHTSNKALSYRSGYIYVNRKFRLTPEEWAYVLAHNLLHFALWHFEEKADPVKWNIACDMYITRFLKDIKVHKTPIFMKTDLPYPTISEQEIYERLLSTELSELHQGYSTGSLYTDLVYEGEFNTHYYLGAKVDAKEYFAKQFEQNLINSVTAAVGVASGYLENIHDDRLKKISKAEAARRWFINSYPLLGALASSFKIIEDPNICAREDVRVAAISERLQTIYMNPGAGLNDDEYKFVIAHELLHIGLRHGSRCQGRDHFLWNVACDYVINGWLVEMGVGVLPQLDILYDTDLAGLSAESIYDIIVKDIRKFRKLATLRGKGLSDILRDDETASFYKAPVALDDFYRRAISEGLEYHKNSRGLLPAGLEEEIRALYRDPIPWDVELSRWFDQFFSPIEKVRTYARASRRQASTPDIIRPKYISDPSVLEGRTFGVVIDTSGSMDQYTLAIALGSVASYAENRDVPYARVIFCDAVAHDAGYMAPDIIMGNVKVRGRGGTVLQPGIDFLEKVADFPKDGPILIITDAECDHFDCRREHAILIPKGARLPFRARGKVFTFE